MSEALRELLGHVKGQRAVDFSAYRSTTLERRLAIRLAATGMKDYSAYLLYVKTNPSELEALIDALTIKVSGFFRDPMTFEVLRERALPELTESFKNAGVRIWCAGCARGEEAYSIAILLKEIAEKEALASKPLIIATDIDREALADAGRAVYQPESLSEVKKDYLERYFVREDRQYTVKEEIRSMVTFARHDITSGRPPKEGIFSNYHLILCRNVLIYLNRELQDRVLHRVSDSLEPGGILVLGEAETANEKTFSGLVPRVKVYRKGGLDREAVVF